ncbi:MAG: hypothetical protein ACE5KG_07405 [Nitrososphaerales archaeon]
MRVDDEKSKSKLLKAISDANMRDILTRTVKEAKSASDLSYETRVPLSSIYRYFRELNESGLVTVERATITDQGKRLELYRSLIKSVLVQFEPSSAYLELQPNEDSESKFYRLWSSIREVSR